MVRGMGGAKIQHRGFEIKILEGGSLPKDTYTDGV